MKYKSPISIMKMNYGKLVGGEEVYSIEIRFLGKLIIKYLNTWDLMSGIPAKF